MGAASRRLARAAVRPRSLKFHAIVVFELDAPDVGVAAGRRLNELLEQVQEQSLETRSLELSAPHGMPVTLSRSLLRRGA